MNQGEKIHVLHIYDKISMKGSPIHGGTRVLMTWWPEFSNTKYKLFLCVFRGRNEGSKLLDEHEINADYLGRNKFDIRIIFDLMRIIRRNNIKILHCHGYGATNFGRIVGLFLRIPVIVHEHMIDSKIPIYQRIADWILSSITAKGIAVSKAVKKFMVNERYLNKNRTDVIYNGIPENCIQPFDADTKLAISKSLDLPVEKKLVGIVGRLNSIKGHFDFLDAAHIVLQEIPEVCFVIVGEGDLREELEQKAHKLNISSNIIFLGHCNNVLEILSLLDVLTICSHSEGCPVSVLEGMAMQTPIVATSVGGIPEILEHERTALLVAPKRPEQIAQAICRILSNAKFAKKISSNSLIELKSNYLVTHTVSQIQKVYDLLLEDHKRLA